MGILGASSQLPALEVEQAEFVHQARLVFPQVADLNVELLNPSVDIFKVVPSGVLALLGKHVELKSDSHKPEFP